jgi:hypothetical protein
MTQLRERSHIILWLLLFFFIASMTVGGLVGGANIMDLILGGKNIRLNAGRVDGKAISHTRYQRQREVQLNRMRNQGQTIDNRAYQNAGDYAWTTIIERELKDQKIKELGLEVSLDEIYDFLVLTPPPAFQTDLINAGLFTNENGKFDTLSYQAAIENGTIPYEIEPLLLNWETFLRTWLADRKLQSMYNNLASISDEQVKLDFIKKNINCTLDYIYLTLSGVPDSLVEVSDDAIEKNYNKNKEDLYTLKERRNMEYVSFQIPKPVTEDDSLNVAVVEDSVMQRALDFTAHAEDYSFEDALIKYEIKKVDTIDVHETFESNSGIPFQMGVLRPAIRFAFDSSIGSLSDPMTANNGIAVFHILSEKSAGYKPVKDVKENIRRNLQREHKKDFAVTTLKSINKTDNWENLAFSDSLLQFSSGETSTLGGSFPGIGKSNQLTGTLLAMEPGQFSGVIETYNAVLKLKMTTLDSFNDSLYQDEYTNIRNQLLNTERSRGFTNWLTEAKKNIKTEDYRSEVY